ncbi:MAG: hypothetical protein CMB26_02390 [Euryarchaeota archaeon]|nr:hypothetical protein [Euryarchaeota archaeon]
MQENSFFGKPQWAIKHCRLSKMEICSALLARFVAKAEPTAKICSCLEWMHYVDSHMLDLIGWIPPDICGTYLPSAALY